LPDSGLTKGPDPSRSLSAAAGPAGPGERRYLATAEVGLVLTLALVPRLIGTDHPPYIDELYNILAAQSLVADGTLEIGQGVPYTRGLLHTHIVAAMFRAFGPGLEAARVPGIIFGTAIVGILFLWVRRASGRLEGWIAALLLALYPAAIALSQVGRFYPAQVLLFWIGTIAVYRGVLEDRPAIGWTVVAGAAFAGALHLQPVSAVGIVGVVLAVAILRGRQATRWAAARRVSRWVALPAGVAAIGLGFVVLRMARRAARMFQHADLWAYEHRSDLLFYHDRFLEQYGMLWLLLPVLLVAAIRKRPGPAVLAAAIFLLAFTFHSLAAWKNERYLHYATPALFAIIGIGAGALVRGARAAVLSASLGVRSRPRRLAFGAGSFAIVVLILATGGAMRTSFDMATRVAPDRPPPYARSDWDAALAYLASAAERSDVVIASADLKALYYLGRLDFDISADHLFDGTRFLPDFTPQSATGTPVIRSTEAVRTIVDCFPSGLFTIERWHWRAPDGVPAGTADLIESLTRPVPVPANLEILAFEWRRGTVPAMDSSAAAPAACPVLPAR
jgi:hypothetical protein